MIELDEENTVCIISDDDNNNKKRNLQNNENTLQKKKKKKIQSTLNFITKKSTNTLQTINPINNSLNSINKNIELNKLGNKHVYNLNENYKILSWNVNGLSSIIKKENIFKNLIENEKPFILCLQETKLSENLRIVDLEKFQIKNYNVYFNHSISKKGYSGTAVYILKNGPNVKKITYGIGIEKHDSEGRCITVELDDVFIVNTYCPNSGQNLKRINYRTKEWDVDLLNYLEKLEKKKPVIWTGDLNVALTEIDVYDPVGRENSAGFTKEERESTPIVKKSNPPFIDTFRYFHKDEKSKFTYYGYKGNKREKKMGWRIDYFIVSEVLRERLVDSYILDEYYGSDHVPIGLILKR
ncbi:hypothetical protein ABK040_005514 [Willaertia magna]